ncbi:MAG: LPS assembly lipoprotein LptE [Archangium sp.]
MSVRLSALLVLSLSACGYRFTAPNASLPAGLTAVQVPMFENKTADPSLELVFTQAARDQLHRAGRLGGDTAEGTLRGSILSISGGPFMTAPSIPRQPGMRVNVSVVLVLEKQGREVGRTGVNYSEEFPSGADVLLTESNREAALRRIADSAVREGLEKLQSAP